MSDVDPSDPVSEGTFYVLGPVWYIVHRHALTLEPRQTIEGLVVGTTPKGTGFVPLFTDKDLADRFVKTQGGSELIPVRIMSPEDFLVILEQFKEQGHTHIGYDPGTTRVRLISIDNAIRDLRRSKEDHERGLDDDREMGLPGRPPA
jgi:hypothetical protein